MSIAAKEARETHYWLRLTLDAKVIPFSQLERLIDDIQEIKRLLTAIVKSATD
jgi:four helix bundle protein